MFRLPSNSMEGTRFEYGFNSDTLRQVIDYWLNEYKWSERQPYINKYPHYTTKIQGLDIHFVHIKPEKATKTVPLLLLHGWPGSFREFYPVLDILTSKTNNKIDIDFEIIVPSLPGYGWSSAASKPGLGYPQMAVVFRNLMRRLGYKNWYIQGGDWGSQIASMMGTFYPSEVAGIHLNLCTSMMRKTVITQWLMSFYPSLFLEERFIPRMYPLKKFFSWALRETGYFHIQATKPDTVGAGLADSPAGLAAYMLEKFWTASNTTSLNFPDKAVEDKFAYTDLLDNIMVYWITNTMTSAMRIYAESYIKENRDYDLHNVQTKSPTWFARFPFELNYPPDFMVRHRYPKLKGVTDFAQGGHFAAMENPKLLAEDIVLAVRKFEEENPIFLGKPKTA